jgi:phosphatidylglycerol lysyltransferase
MTSSWPEPVRRARDLVMEHGWNATSYQIVNPGIDHWFSQQGDAVVGYVERAGVRVVAGAPVSSAERLPDVVGEFEKSAADAGVGVCYFGAEARLEGVLRDSPSHSMVLLGAQPAWNPVGWSAKVDRYASLRAQFHRATNKGVRVREWSPAEATGSPRLRAVLDRWLAGRGLPPMHFLVEPSTLERLRDRRIFVAWRPVERGKIDNQILAFAVLSPVPERSGWLVEQFPRIPGAPNGTIELLLNEAVRAVTADGAEYLTLGLAPLAKRDSIQRDLEPRWLRLALRWTSAHGNRFYNFGGLESFKAKFLPDTWEPIYAIQRAHSFSPRALYAIAGAFASESPLILVAKALASALLTEIRSGFGQRRRA